MKKTLSSILALIMICTLFTFSTNADEIKYSCGLLPDSREDILAISDGYLDENGKPKYSCGALPDSREDILAISDGYLDENGEPKYSCGLLPDSPKDILAIADVKMTAAEIAALPTAVDNTSKFPSPGDQGSQGSCVGWAVGYALMSNAQHMYRSWTVNSSNHNFSPSYIFNQLTDSQGGGTNCGSALNLICNKGVCPLTYWAYSESDYSTQPTAIQNAAASLYKSSSYYATLSIEQIKNRISQGYGVVIGVKVYPDLYNLSAENQIYDNTLGNTTSNHAICLIGYDNSKGNGAFKFINSWGTDWGLGGYGWISYDFVNSSINVNGKGVGYYITHPTNDNYLMGDADGDGDIDSADARQVLCFSVNSDTPTAMQYVLSDVDGDAQITASDAREVLRYSTGDSTKFPLYN